MSQFTKKDIKNAIAHYEDELRVMPSSTRNLPDNDAEAIRSYKGYCRRKISKLQELL